MSDYSRDSIIASNLAKEWLELVISQRDQNFKSLTIWNKMPWNNYDLKFSTWWYYKIEKSNWTNLISMTKINDIDDISDYRLCIDSDDNYIYCSSNPDSLETKYYRYLYFEDVEYDNWDDTEIIHDSLKVVSKVFWHDRWRTPEVEIKTIITNWKRY